MVGRRCGWRSYVHSPRGPGKISTLHSRGHLPTMEDRSTLRKQCSGISLSLEVLRLTIRTWQPFTKSLLAQRSISVITVDILQTIWAHVLCTAIFRLFNVQTILLIYILYLHFSAQDAGQVFIIQRSQHAKRRR